MGTIIFKAYGRNGSVALYQDRLVIRKKTSVLKTDLISAVTEIFLDTLSYINFEPASDVTLGFIQFETPGNAKQLSNGLFFTSPIDNYSVVFSEAQGEEFEQLKNEINSKLHKEESEALVDNEFGCVQKNKAQVKPVLYT